MSSLQEVIAQVLTCEKCELSQRCGGPVPMSMSLRGQKPSARAATDTSSTLPSKDVTSRSSIQIHSVESETIPKPDFIVLGEAPGRVEDNQGLPFVGPAGQLIRKVFTDLGIQNRAIYMNSVSCWPKLEADKKPTTDQKKACRQNLKDQLDVAGTPWVLSCGTIATQSLVKHATAATNGHIIPIHGKVVFPVYHPAFILYRKDQELYQKWKTEIGAFMILMAMEMDTDEHNPTCLYCKNPKYSNLMTCYKHRKDWMVDQVWDQKTRRKKGIPLPGQEGMFGE